MEDDKDGLTRWYVKLIYFKEFGKYYSGGSYISNKKALYEIWAEVAEMQRDRKLPGLREGATFPIISVKVPQHPHKHPHLVINYMKEVEP